MSAAGPAAAPGVPVTAPETAPGPPWPLLVVLLVGQFMALLDVSIVNVALPAVGRDLAASGAALQLIVSGYIVSYAMLLITGARLGSTYGIRRLFRIGTALFTLSSLACGLAPTANALVGARVLQGIGAALMMPQVMSVIQLRFTGAARARALSAYSAVLAAGGVVGLVLGGVLVDLDPFGSDWRSVFLVNVPVGLAVWLLVPRVMREEFRLSGRGRRLDLPGLAVAVPAVMLLVVPLVLGREEGWPAWAFASLAAGVVALTVFVLLERRIAARGRDPLLDLGVLRSRGMPSGMVTLAAGMCAYGGYLFSMTLHLQDGLGDGPLRTGLTFAPAAATFGLCGYFWRRLPVASHPWLPPLGLALGGLGFLFTGAVLASGTRGGVALLLILGIAGVGFGVAFSPLVTHALVHVPLAKAADASGILTTVLQLSQVVGVAVFGTIFLSGVGDGGRLASAQAVNATLTWMAVLMAAGALTGVLLTRVLLDVRRNPA